MSWGRILKAEVCLLSLRCQGAGGRTRHIPNQGRYYPGKPDRVAIVVRLFAKRPPTILVCCHAVWSTANMQFPV